MGWPAIKRLSPETEQLACELVIGGERLDKVAKAIGLTDRTHLQRYLVKYPEFFEQFDRARIAQCIGLEEDLLFCADDYTDFKSARVKMESIARILKYRDPKRYGDRIDMNITQTIDIAGALDAAERRVIDISQSNVIALTSSTTDKK